MHSYDDDDLAAAIAACRSWRGVLRALGLPANSGSGLKTLQRRARRLGLDCHHFTGQRGWTSADFAVALEASRSWNEVAQRLGLTGGSARSTLKGHARRLGLDVAHLETPPEPEPAADYPAASVAHLRRAGSLLAAAWFTLHGYDVAWPLEPCRYDLIVIMDGSAQRIQVKTTQTRVGSAWKVDLSSAGKQRVAYDPDDIDFFFAISGDLDFYLIPLAAVGGFHSIHLSAYSAYRLDGLQLAA